MQAENIKTLSFGCRLNALESEKIKTMLAPYIKNAIIVNTCAVTGEAERQSGQTVRKLSRENPNVPIFVTGCAATRNPKLFENIPYVAVIHNYKKLDLAEYLTKTATLCTDSVDGKIVSVPRDNANLSKQFIQIQNGCSHHCTYCVTRLLRGPSVSFDYQQILNDVTNAVKNGFFEIVLTGIDIASYAKLHDGHVFLISDLCKQLLTDVPAIKRLRLSSMDPASPEIYKIIDLIHNNTRMMPHLHLSMQSGSDTILIAMQRRHSAKSVQEMIAYATGITFSWDIICGFPGETDELFNETLDLVRKTKPIKIHAFPFSPRPDTVAATMPNQINQCISKQRVKIITELADNNLSDYMATQTGKRVSVLVENDNFARTPDDIPVKIMGTTIPPKTICDITLDNIDNKHFIGIKK